MGRSPSKSEAKDVPLANEVTEAVFANLDAAPLRNRRVDTGVICDA